MAVVGRGAICGGSDGARVGGEEGRSAVRGSSRSIHSPESTLRFTDEVSNELCVVENV